MNIKNATKVLKDFCDCLDDKYFLVYGTCLGAVREGNILKHDLDIDVGIMREDFKMEYVNRLIKNGFSLYNMFGSLEFCMELSFRKLDVKVDLMFFYKEKNLIYNALCENGGRNGLGDLIIHSYEPKLFEINELAIEDNYFYSLGVDYIRAVYGENWRVPVEKWDWKTDHLCRDDGLKIKLIEKYGK